MNLLDRIAGPEDLAGLDPAICDGIGLVRTEFLFEASHGSAAALRIPEARFDAGRCGIALYGVSPFGADPAEDGLQPLREAGWPVLGGPTRWRSRPPRRWPSTSGCVPRSRG